MVPSFPQNLPIVLHLPPPPPPPPGTKVGKLCNSSITKVVGAEKGISHENVLSSEEEQTKKAYSWYLRDNGFTEDDLGDFVFISSYKPVKPIIQNGPLCGMVALAMTSELVGRAVSTEDIFDEAKRCHYSYQGEMFSASCMQSLASKFTDCDVELVALNPNGRFSCIDASAIIIKALLQHTLVLLPYDADKNHGPSQALGHKAHWALITGFFTAVKKNVLRDNLFSCLRQDEEIKRLHYWDSHRNLDNEDFVNLLSEKSDFQIFSHQGKSKYCGTWNLKDMVESNNNLMEVGPERNLDEYLLPPGGVQEGLRCKAVFINPRNR